MSEWTKHPYGKTQDPFTQRWTHDGAHWTITDGQMSFDVHVLKLMSKEGTKELVSPAQANEYAEKIVNALNAAGVSV
mgnify:CR=1 FL=1